MRKRNTIQCNRCARETEIVWYQPKLKPYEHIYTACRQAIRKVGWYVMGEVLLCPMCWEIIATAYKKRPKNAPRI